MNPKELEKIAPILRIRILRMINAAGAGHPGGSLSVLDVLSSLMMGWGRFSPQLIEKDWLVLGKGHSVPALYSILVELGYINEEEIFTYRHLHSRLQGHPDRTKLPAIQVTTGHLGQGLSIGVGIALGEKMSETDKKIYVILGDGDMQEGQTWEALMSAAHFKLDNLVVIIDMNGLTQHGPVEKIMNYQPLEEKLYAFGWETHNIDGHQYESIFDGFSKAKDNGKPNAIISHTIKGKGVSFMEGDPLWHSRDLPDELLEKAINELRGENK